MPADRDPQAAGLNTLAQIASRAGRPRYGQPPPPAGSPWAVSEARGQWAEPHASGRWSAPPAHGEWAEPYPSGQWEEPYANGQWEEPYSTGQWEEPYASGQWAMPDASAQRPTRHANAQYALPPATGSAMPYPDQDDEDLGADWSDNPALFREGLSSFGVRKARKLHRRLARWKPAYWPLITAFLIILVIIGWVSEPIPGKLGWPLTIVWTWPIISTCIGIRGIRRTRKVLRKTSARWAGTGRVTCEDFLIVVVPTIGRHDIYPALERSVLSYIAYLPSCFPWLRIDIVIEEGCEAAGRIAKLAARSELVRIVTVPARYRTRHGTKFKARANHFSHELRMHQGEDRNDIWVLHMDDDTGVGPDTAVAMARFIEEQFRAGRDAKHMAQGILTYPRQYAVNRFTWLADSIRPADDIARFSAFTGSGTPRAGLHGELLLVRASVEATIGWDFGPQSIVEDAQFAFVFCEMYKGRSAWFGGRCYGASPATIRDFVRQRERWSWGLVGLAFNRSLPRRNRLLLAYSLAAWIVGPFQNVFTVFLIGWLLADTNNSPVSLFIVPIWALNLAYMLWMYWEGLRLNAGVSAGGRRKWWEPFAVLLLIPFFGLMEGFGGLRGFLKFARRAENKFIVIAKPS